jgi:hypothetical protein
MTGFPFSRKSRKFVRGGLRGGASCPVIGETDALASVLRHCKSLILLHCAGAPVFGGAVTP